MTSKKLVFLCMIIGSIIGGFIPELWGDRGFSIYSVILTAVGGLLGVWLAFKISN